MVEGRPSRVHVVLTQDEEGPEGGGTEFLLPELSASLLVLIRSGARCHGGYEDS